MRSPKHAAAGCDKLVPHRVLHPSAPPRLRRLRHINRPPGSARTDALGQMCLAISRLPGGARNPCPASCGRVGRISPDWPRWPARGFFLLVRNHVSILDCACASLILFFAMLSMFVKSLPSAGVIRPAQPRAVPAWHKNTPGFPRVGAASRQRSCTYSLMRQGLCRLSYSDI